MSNARTVTPGVFLLLAALAGCGPEPAALVDTTGSTYRVGQVWSYRTRPQEPESTLTVVKVESHPKLGTIVHISLQGLRMKSPRAPDGYAETISHLPMSAEALDKSVVKLLRENAPLPEFQEGYKEWRRGFDAGKAGFFTIPVAEAVGIAETSLNGGGEVKRKGA
jgi:hypothetical protein